MIDIENNKLTMKNDIMFKAFFSKKENEKFLKSFLSAILGEKIKIRRVIHDARLDKVIIISILDYNLINLPEYITKTVRVADKHREYEINNKVEFYYIELKKFREQNPDMKEPINQWLSFIDMEKGERLEMAKKENKEIEEAVEEYETLTGNALVKRLEEIRLMSELEEQSALETAKNEGKEEGREEGIKEGIKEGKEEGKKQEKISTAKKLLKLKMPIEQIIEVTELTKEEILELEK